MVQCYQWCLPGIRFGPLLFIIYINDLLEYINCNIKQFADDISFMQLSKASMMCHKSNMTLIQ